MRFALLFPLLANCALAQQTIFDVPSADVSGRRQWFYQHQTVLRTWRPERHWIQTNAVGAGVGKAVELDVTWFNLETGAAMQTIPSIGLKWSPHLNSERARLPIRFNAGDMIEMRPVKPHTGNWAHAMLNAELPKAHTRLTGGFTSGTSVPLQENRWIARRELTRIP